MARPGGGGSRARKRWRKEPRSLLGGENAPQQATAVIPPDCCGFHTQIIFRVARTQAARTGMHNAHMQCSSPHPGTMASEYSTAPAPPATRVLLKRVETQ